jgi:presenilin-like A22 family membrane protease
MKIKRPTKQHPVFVAVILFIVAQILTLSIAYQESTFLEANNIHMPTQPDQAIALWPGPMTSPSGEVTQTPAYSSLGPIVIYFLAVTAGVTLMLARIPLSALRLALRILFACLFAWGAFIAFVFWTPLAGALGIAAAVAIVWFLMPRVWFHDMAMILALASIGAIFGHFITPWTIMAVMGALAIYDIIAVRFGFMLWLTRKLSGVGVLPAFVIPKSPSQWRADLRQGAIADVVDKKPAERVYSLLGGGDIAFPCLLTASVYFARGLGTAFIIAAFTLLGLVLAYLIQAIFLKGRAVSALPPIAALALAGLMTIR